MEASVAWDNETQTVIRYSFSGEWAWREVENTVVQAHGMLDSVDHTVDTIIDISQASVSGRMDITRGKWFVSSRHRNTNRVVMVGAHRFIQSLFNVFRRVYKKNDRIVFVSTLDEARSLLQRKAA